MTNPSDDRNETPKAVKAVAEVLAATTGLAVGGPEGAVAAAGMTPYALAAARKSWDEIIARRQHSVALLVSRAAKELEEEPQQLVDHAMSTQPGAELLADALYAAAETLNEQKVAALAKAVANGLADDQAHIDQERLVVRALAELEAPHVALLVRMAMNAQTMGERRFFPWVSRLTIDHFWYGERGRTAVPVLLQVLERNSLIEDNSDEKDQERAKHAKERLDRLDAEIQRLKPGSGGPRFGRSPAGRDRTPDEKWRVTAFGGAVVDHLQPTAANDTAPDA